MAVPYYDLTKVKLDLNITDTGNDTQLASWNDEAEAEIDDFIYDKVSKARRITSLPVLPFTAGSVPQTIQGAADHMVKAKYYEFTKNVELVNHHNNEAKGKLNKYIERLEVDQVIYGRIV